MRQLTGAGADPSALVRRYPFPRAVFSAFIAFRHILTHCAHSQHFDGSRSECQKSFHQVFSADLPHLSATETTSSSDSSSFHTFFSRVDSALSGGMEHSRGKHKL